MKGWAVLLTLVCALALMSCATPQGEPDAVAMQPPQVQPPQAPPSKSMSRSDMAKMCSPGTYFCPGRVNGCCPNGWGCTSTHCVRPAGQLVERDVDKQAVGKDRPNSERMCAPGTYFCPGRVNGCCPNGWGCASTHCIRPKGHRDL
jgi:hypothetical protein